MKLLITGGSGFFGWNAVRHFSQFGHDIVTTFYSHEATHYLHSVPRCQPVRLNVADRSEVEEVVARFQPNLIIHAAALAKPQIHRNADELYAVNCEGSGNVARAANAVGSRIVYISTDLVYANSAGYCDEETPAHPDTVYGSSKLAGEQAVREEAEQWLVLRPSLMYGDGPDDSNSFSQFLERCWNHGKPAPLFTDQYRSFLHVEDLCSAVSCLITHPDSWNRTVVCGGEERMSRAEFGVRYARLKGVDPSMIVPMRSNQLEGYTGGSSDIALRSDVLSGFGWSVQHRLPGIVTDPDQD